MSNWTRAHDAWIAEKCEGITLFAEDEDIGLCFYDEDSDEGYGPDLLPVPGYLTDTAAAIRAAEAWRKKVQGREVRLEWRENDVIAGLGDKQAGWHQWYEPCDRPAAALAQALYRATGGPA